MSNQCTALATKKEVQALQADIDSLEGQLGKKVDNSEKPEIIQAGGSIGASLALAALDPRVRALLAKVASLAGKVLNLVAKVSAIFSLIASLASIAMVTLLQIRVARLEKQVKGLTSLANNAFATANAANARANKAIENANFATKNANQAIKEAKEAIKEAQNAIAASNSAVAEANRASAEASLARAEASIATARAKEAIKEANVAKIEANTATRVANTASAEANQARTKANTATREANKALSEVAQLRQENQELKSTVLSLTTKVGKIEQQIKSEDNQPSLTAKRAFELASTNKQNLDLLRGDTKQDIEDVKEETLQERLRRERQERIDAKFKSQSELRAELEQRKSDNFKSQTELQLELQRNILERQSREDSKISRDTFKKIAVLERQLEQERQERENDIRNLVRKGGISLANPRLKDLIDSRVNTKVEAIEQVNQEQYEDLRNRIGGVPALVGVTVVGGLAPKLGDLSRGIRTTIQNTKFQILTDAASTGVCRSTAPGGCMQRNVVDKLTGNVGDLINAGGTAFSAANNALLLKMNGTLNAVNKTVTTIKSVANSTNAVINHSTHGLAAIQNFASTAWKVTRADKIMNGVSLALTIHNAMMLSNNLLSTMSEATNMALDALGIKDETDTPLDFRKAIKGKINSVLTSILGAEAYAKLTARTAKANRIYQTGINVLDTTRDLFDSAHSIAEIGIEHTGQIGNALRDAGVVAEDAYGEMMERVNPQNKALRQIAKFRAGADYVEEALDTVSTISSEVIEVKDNFEELRDEKEKFQEETF